MYANQYLTPPQPQPIAFLHQVAFNQKLDIQKERMGKFIDNK